MTQTTGDCSSKHKFGVFVAIRYASPHVRELRVGANHIFVPGISNNDKTDIEMIISKDQTERLRTRNPDEKIRNPKDVPEERSFTDIKK
jgi:hypothetical protein